METAGLNSDRKMETAAAKTEARAPHENLVQRRWGDAVFKRTTLLTALSVFGLIGLIGYELAHGSRLAVHKFGWHFLAGSDGIRSTSSSGRCPLSSARWSRR